MSSDTLSDDEVAELQARPSTELDGYRRVLLRPRERDALCATVRALRERIDKLNTLGEKMLTRLEKVADIGRKADHGWNFVVGEVERQHNALREQLAQRDKVGTYESVLEALQCLITAGLDKEGEPNTLLAMIQKIITERDELQSQLVQVTQEREALRQEIEFLKEA